MQMEGWYQSSLPNSARQQLNIFTKTIIIKSQTIPYCQWAHCLFHHALLPQRLPKADIYYASVAAIHVTFS